MDERMFTVKQQRNHDDKCVQQQKEKKSTHNNREPKDETQSWHHVLSDHTSGTNDRDCSRRSLLNQANAWIQPEKNKIAIQDRRGLCAMSQRPHLKNQKDA